MKLIISILFLILPLSLWSQILYVTTTGAGLKNGSTWDNAMEGVQYAFDNAPPNSEIWVKAGTYYIPTSFNINGKPLKLYAGFIGGEQTREQRDFKNNVTKLTNGTIKSSLSINNILTSYFILDGFTVGALEISNFCYYPIVANCNFMEVDISGFNKLVLINNIFIEGGISIDSYSGLLSYNELIVTNNLIYNNNNEYWAALDIQLQGIAIGQKVIIANNTICNNTKQWNDVNDEVGISVLLENPTITGSFIAKNNLFYNNRFLGVNYHTNFQNLLRYCAFDGNTANGTNINLTSSPFVSTTNFSLQSNSQCINTGTPDTTGLHLPLVDLAGNPRIYNNRIDIGAYEYTPYSANFTYSNTCQSLLTQFTITNLNGIQSVIWNFGDSQTSTQINPIHIYSNAGIFTVTLTATFTNGQQQTVNKQVTINPKPLNLIITHK